MTGNDVEIETPFESSPRVEALNMVGAHTRTTTTPDFEPMLLTMYLLASVIAFCAFAVDKQSARAGSRRLPERTLFVLALVGGWPGAYLAQALFRHKTRKLSFQMRLGGATLINGGALAWLLLAPSGQLLRSMVG